MNAPDQGIPRDLLESAKCIAIIPGGREVRLYLRRQLRPGTGNLSHRAWLERSHVFGY